MRDIAPLKKNHKTLKPWTFVFFIVVAFFIVNTFLAYRSTTVVKENTANIDNTLQIITLIKELQVQLNFAESGQRGYVITSDAQYLERFDNAIDQIEVLLATLSETNTRLPQQRVRFERLTEDINEKIKEMHQTNGYVKNRESHAALRIVNTDRGIALSRSIQALIEEMELDELKLLAKNRARAEESRIYTLWAAIVTNTLGLILAISVYLISMRYTRQLNALYLEIERANKELENKVKLRTEAIERYSQELERSNNELQDFAFVASHDLQEPLRKIRAFGDRLLSKYADQLGDRGMDYVKRMHAASERMSLLIDDLLSFSRITTRQKPFEPVDLNKLFDRVLDDLEFAITQNDAIIEIENLPTVEGDESQLGQVFSNLLSNSLKFIRPDVQPVISVRAIISDSLYPGGQTWIRILVQDNGIGFDSHYKDRIFSLFQRLHGREEYTGTGIGLALCKKIVERHNGQIDVTAEPEKGATFIVDLPLEHKAGSEPKGTSDEQ